MINRKPLPHDPKLRDAAEEFKALCRKYDCMGFVLLVSPTHSEFVSNLEASWSIASIGSAGPGQYGIRFRSKREDWPTKEAQDEATLATTHALTSVIEWSRQLNGSMRSVLEQLGQHMRIAWKTWGAPDSTPGDGQ